MSCCWNGIWSRKKEVGRGWGVKNGKREVGRGWRIGWVAGSGG